MFSVGFDDSDPNWWGPPSLCRLFFIRLLSHIIRNILIPFLIFILVDFRDKLLKWIVSRTFNLLFLINFKSSWGAINDIPNAYLALLALLWICFWFYPRSQLTVIVSIFHTIAFGIMYSLIYYLLLWIWTWRNTF